MQMKKIPNGPRRRFTVSNATNPRGTRGGNAGFGGCPREGGPSPPAPPSLQDLPPCLGQFEGQGAAKGQRG